MSQPLEPGLNAIYARLWIETNTGAIPKGLEPFKSSGELSEREQGIYTEAMWKILNLMATDGLITRAELRAAHEERNNWRPGTSTIHAGYVPPKQVSDQKAAA